METKSEGMLEFENGIAALERRIEHGEVSDPLGPGREYARILAAALPRMTESERAAIQRSTLRAHQMGAEILAAHGMPVPGSDPTKPN